MNTLYGIRMGEGPELPKESMWDSLSAEEKKRYLDNFEEMYNSREIHTSDEMQEIFTKGLRSGEKGFEDYY